MSCLGVASIYRPLCWGTMSLLRRDLDESFDTTGPKRSRKPAGDPSKLPGRNGRLRKRLKPAPPAALESPPTTPKTPPATGESKSDTRFQRYKIVVDSLRAQTRLPVDQLRRNLINYLMQQAETTDHDFRTTLESRFTTQNMALFYAVRIRDFRECLHAAWILYLDDAERQDQPREVIKRATELIDRARRLPYEDILFEGDVPVPYLPPRTDTPCIRACKMLYHTPSSIPNDNEQMKKLVDTVIATNRVSEFIQMVESNNLQAITELEPVELNFELNPDALEKYAQDVDRAYAEHVPSAATQSVTTEPSFLATGDVYEDLDDEEAKSNTTTANLICDFAKARDEPKKMLEALRKLQKVNPTTDRVNVQLSGRNHEFTIAEWIVILRTKWEERMERVDYPTAHMDPDLDMENDTMEYDTSQMDTYLFGLTKICAILRVACAADNIIPEGIQKAGPEFAASEVNKGPEKTTYIWIQEMMTSCLEHITGGSETTKYVCSNMTGAALNEYANLPFDKTRDNNFEYNYWKEALRGDGVSESVIADIMSVTAKGSENEESFFRKLVSKLVPLATRAVTPTADTNRQTTEFTKAILGEIGARTALARLFKITSKPLEAIGYFSSMNPIGDFSSMNLEGIVRNIVKAAPFFIYPLLRKFSPEYLYQFGRFGFNLNSDLTAAIAQASSITSEATGLPLFTSMAGSLFSESITYMSGMFRYMLDIRCLKNRWKESASRPGGKFTAYSKTRGARKSGQPTGWLHLLQEKFWSVETSEYPYIFQVLRLVKGGFKLLEIDHDGNHRTLEKEFDKKMIESMLNNGALMEIPLPIGSTIHEGFSKYTVVDRHKRVSSFGKVYGEVTGDIHTYTAINTRGDIITRRVRSRDVRTSLDGVVGLLKYVSPMVATVVSGGTAAAWAALAPAAYDVIIGILDARSSGGSSLIMTIVNIMHMFPGHMLFKEYIEWIPDDWKNTVVQVIDSHFGSGQANNMPLSEIIDWWKTSNEDRITIIVPFDFKEDQEKYTKLWFLSHGTFLVSRKDRDEDFKAYIQDQTYVETLTTKNNNYFERAIDLNEVHETGRVVFMWYNTTY